MALEFSLEEALGKGTQATTEFSLDEALGRAPVNRESTIGSELVRGGKQLASSMRTGFGALGGSPEEAAKAGIKRGEAIAEEAGEGASLDAVKRAYQEKGLLSAAGEVVSQVPRAVASQGAQLALMAGGAKAGALAGSAIAPGPGTVIGGVLGAGATLLPQLFGSNVERQASEQMARNEDVNINRVTAGGAAVAQSGLEAAGTVFVLGKRLVKGVLGITDDAALATAKAQKDMVEAANRSLLYASGRGTVRGAAVEMPIEVASSVIERAQAGLDVTSPDAIKEYGEVAYQSALVGGALGTAGGAADTAMARQKVPKQTSEAVTAFEKEKDEFRKNFGPTESVAVPQEAAVAEPPTEFPGGYTATRREVSREDVPESFGIFAEGSDKPLTTVTKQDEVDAKLQSLSEIRQEEQARLLAESEKITKSIFDEQRKLEVMEATGQTDSDQYVQSKALLEQRKDEAAQQIKDIKEKIASYSAPLRATPIGVRTDIKNEFNVSRGTEPVGTFSTLEEVEASLREREPELFKQAEVAAEVAARKKELDNTLRPLITKFNLGDVGLNVVDQLERNAGGRYLDKLIEVSLQEANPLQTMRHESLHALKDLGFFTPQQWKALTERAEKEWIVNLKNTPYEKDVTRYDAYLDMFTKEGQAKGLAGPELQQYANEALIEEAIADAFGAYDKGAPPPPGMIAALFKKLKDFFMNFGQALRGAGFESSEDIFQRVERGELKSRKPKAKPAKPEVKPTPKDKAETAEAPEREAKYSLAGEDNPMSTRKFMEQQTPFAQQELGLNTEAKRGRFNNVREIARALNERTKAQLGVMDRNNLTQDESTRIAEAIVDEVAYQLQSSSQTGTGLGWYSNNYPNAVKRLAKRFPELGSSKHARSVFSALVAVTSNGERVAKNIDNAIKLYGKLRDGKPLVAMGNRRPTALQNNLKVIEDLLEEHGENFEEVLLQEITVREMNARLREMGEKADGSYLANTVVPAAAIYFGPKLGAFYANLSGSEGYLTMDLWWTRSLNRMRGLLMPKATEASIGKFRDMMERPDATRDEVVAATIPLRDKYEEYGYTSELEHLVGAKEPSTNVAKPAWFKKAQNKGGDAYDQLLYEHNLEKMANTIYKNEFEMIQEAPFTGGDRKFMYDAGRKAQAMLKAEGVDLTLADIQAALWYYEKRLYAKLSGRKADDIGYEEAIIAQANQVNRPAGRSVVFDKQPDRRDEPRAEVKDSEETGGVNEEKLSLRKGVIAEVAPNPQQISAEKWREMTPYERLNATKAVANKTMSSVFSELGLRGYGYKFSTGTYEGEVNPNIIVEAPDSATEQELDELGRVLGYVLDQKAMVAFDESNTTSGSQAGFVKVVIPDGMSDSDLNELRTHISQNVPQADGDTLRDGALLYGNFSAYNDNVDTLTDKQYHKAIIDAIDSFPYDDTIRVSDVEIFHSSLIWPDTRSDYLKETRYGESGEIQGEAGADVRGQRDRRLQAISENAITLRDKWIDARGAARLGGRERGDAVDFGKPTAEYGKPIQGSVSAVGVHFSKEPRKTIISDFYGTGLRGLEGERLAERENADIRSRIYFYVDNGKGIRPESGVGGSSHVIKLNNLYDTSKDPLRVIKDSKGDSSADRANKWERALKKLGFDGYLVKDPVASQDYAVLVGKHEVKTGKLSLRTNFPSVKAVKEAVADKEVPQTDEFKRFIAGNQWVDEKGEPRVFYHATAGKFFEFDDESKVIYLSETPEEAEPFGKVAEDRFRQQIYRALNKKDKLDFFQRVVDGAVESDKMTKDQALDFMRKANRKIPDYGKFGDIEAEVMKALMDLSPTSMSIMPLYVRAETPFDFENPEQVAQIMKWIEGNVESKSENADKKFNGLKGQIVQGIPQAIEGEAVQKALKRFGFDGYTLRKRGQGKSYAVYNAEQLKSVTGNLGEYGREKKDIRYSLRSAPTTPEFKRWFGDSKVVDKDGKPLVVYHGTKAFDEYGEAEGEAISQFAGVPNWFAEEPYTASGYAGAEGSMYPAYLSIKKPLTITNFNMNDDADAAYALARRLGVDVGSLYLAKDAKAYNVVSSPQFVEAAQNAGYDGIKVKEGEYNTYAAFEPTQIKSATGNKGTYDPNNPDIRYSLKSSAGAFDQNEIEKNSQTQYKSREKLVEMRIDDFLPLAKYTDPNSAYSKRKLADAKKLLAAGTPYETLPYLSTDEGQVTGHEGRHRAMALKEAGYDTMPVILMDNGIRWSEQVDPERFDYIEDWPTKLRAEKGAKDPAFSIDFPVAREDSAKHYQRPKYSLPNIPANVQNRMDESVTKRVEKGFAQRMIEAISPRSAASFRAGAVNRYNQQSVYDQILANQMGGNALLADQSAESAALMSDLGAGVAASAMGFGDRNGGIPVLRNGITTIDTSVKGLIASLSPLAAQGDSAIYQRYQYWAMVKRGQRLNSKGVLTGIDTADVAFAKVLEQKHPEFVSVQKDLVAFNNGLVKYMVDTGVLSKERGAEYIKYADYIPFYRQMDGEKTLGPSLFASLSGVKPPKKLKGAVIEEAPLADFLETMVRNTQSSIQAGMKNYAAQRTIDVVTQVKAPGMGAIRLNAPSTAPNTISLLEKGVLVSYETPDNLLIEAVKSLNMNELPFMGIIAGPANLLRNLVTKDPGFMMANLLRDSLSAYVTSGVKMTPIADTIMSFGKSLARKSTGFEALLNAGIIGGYEFSDNIERSGRLLGEDLEKKTGTRKDAKVLRPFKSLWDALETGTTASDAATRAVIYERVLAETGNEAEALYRSLEVMNFHRKGNSPLIRVLTAAVPFFNARLQGLDLFYRASFGKMNNKDAAAIQRQFWARGMTMAALSGLYWFMVSDDEEYKKQEQETKDNNWLIPSLGIRIPIPFEVGVLFKTIPERIAAYTFGNDTGKDLREALLRAAVGTFAFNPTPQTIKPIVEAAFNFNTFTFREVVSEGMKDVAAEYQVGPGTSTFAKMLAQNLGLSPIKVDHVIKGYVGTMGMYAIDTIDIVLDQFGDSPKATKRFEQLPIIKRFALDKEARGSVTQYYELKDAVDTVVRTINFLEKTGESEAYVEYLTKNQGTFAFKDYIRDTEKTMKSLRDMRTAIRTSQMGGDEKRDALLEISKAESAITSEIQEIKKAIASAQ